MAKLRWLVAIALLGCSTRITDVADSADASVVRVADANQLVRSDSGVVYCGAVPCQCSDGIDNDGDGLIDGFDPECTSAGDNDESSFATGLRSEDRSGKCVGCFFDVRPVTGNDACRRATSCATLDNASGGNGSCARCNVDATCSGNCMPLVPNGCDCFGCCGVWRGSSVTNILLGNTRCTIDTLDDPTVCTPCTQASDCNNPCGACELCPGRTVSDLPSTCSGYTCEQTPVCTDTAQCSGLTSCQQGCCLAVGI